MGWLFKGRSIQIQREILLYIFTVFVKLYACMFFLQFLLISYSMALTTQNHSTKSNLFLPSRCRYVFLISKGAVAAHYKVNLAKIIYRNETLCYLKQVMSLMHHIEITDRKKYMNKYHRFRVLSFGRPLTSARK